MHQRRFTRCGITLRLRKPNLSKVQPEGNLAKTPALYEFGLGARSEPSTSALLRQQNIEETQVKNVLERINLTLLLVP